MVGVRTRMNWLGRRRRKKRGHVTSALRLDHVRTMEAAPCPEQRTDSLVSLESWLASALLATRPGHTRLEFLASNLRERGIDRPSLLSRVSDAALSESGFSDDEKKWLNTARRTANAALAVPLLMTAWTSASSSAVEQHPLDAMRFHCQQFSPAGAQFVALRLVEVRIVCSTVQILQISLVYHVAFRSADEILSRVIQRKYPADDFCGAISTRRLELSEGEYATRVGAFFEVVSNAAMAYGTTQSTSAYRLTGLEVFTSLRRRPWTTRTAISAAREARLYGRRPMRMIKVDITPDSDDWVLAGLVVRPGVVGRIGGLGAVWCRRSAPDIFEWSNLRHQADDDTVAARPDALPSANPTERNAYTGARIATAAGDPWLRTDDDITVAVQRPFSLVDLESRTTAHAFCVVSPSACAQATVLAFPVQTLPVYAVPTAVQF